MSARREDPAGASHFVVALALDHPPTDGPEGLKLAALAAFFRNQGARHITIANAGPANPEAWHGEGLAALAPTASVDLGSGTARHFGGGDFTVTLLPAGCGRAAIVTAVRRFQETASDVAGLGAGIQAVAGPQPDLILTFAGRKSLEDMFVWQAGYAEFVHLDAPWSKATEADLAAALAEFRRRNRRFGDVPAPAAS